MPKAKQKGKAAATGGGRKAKGGEAAAKGQAQWKATHAYKEGLSARAHGSEIARRSARVKLAERMLERAEKQDRSSAAALQKRCELADALIHAGDGVRAVTVLKKSLELDASDAAGARRRLAPLLLRLGMRDEAAELLARFDSDSSTVMACSRLLIAVEDQTPRVDEALREALKANAPLCWLLAAPRARSSGCTREALPPALVDELREVREKASAIGATRPAAGGAEECLLLVTGEFAGWATCEDEDEWGEANTEDGWREPVSYLVTLLDAFGDWNVEVGVEQGDSKKAVVCMASLLKESAADARAAEGEDELLDDALWGGDGPASTSGRERAHPSQAKQLKRKAERKADEAEARPRKLPKPPAAKPPTAKSPTVLKPAKPAPQAQGATAKRSRSAFEEWKAQKAAELRERQERRARGECALEPCEEPSDSGGEDDDDESD